MITKYLSQYLNRVFKTMVLLTDLFQLWDLPSFLSRILAIPNIHHDNMQFFAPKTFKS